MWKVFQHVLRRMKILLNCKKIMLGLLVGTFFLTSCTAPSFSEPSQENAENQKTNDSDLSNLQENISIDTNVDEKENFYGIGDTINFSSGANLTILDVGTYTESFSDAMGFIYVYVEVDIENTSNEELTTSASDVAFYADDYRLETGFPSAVTDNITSVTISPGRKARGRYYAEISDYDNVTSVEAEFGNAIVVVKDISDIEKPEDSREDDYSNLYEVIPYETYESYQEELRLYANLVWNDDGSVDLYGFGYLFDEFDESLITETHLELKSNDLYENADGSVTMFTESLEEYGYLTIMSDSNPETGISFSGDFTLAVEEESV